MAITIVKDKSSDYLYAGRDENDRLISIDELGKMASTNKEAQCAMGDFFSTDENLNPEEAMKWYRQAAEQGHARAQWFLGSGLFKGIGVEPSEDEAKYWFEKSAEQNNPDGQCGLGWYYFSKYDYATAKRWLEKAAEQGHADAQSLLETVLLLMKHSP